MAKKQTTKTISGPNLLDLQDTDYSNILGQLPENIYLYSYLGISPGFDEHWEHFINNPVGFSIDSETYHPHHPNLVPANSKEKAGGLRYDARVRLIQISPFPGDFAFILDLGAEGIDRTAPPEGLPQILDQLKGLCECKGILKLGHNIQFDMTRFKVNFGWNVAGVKDTMIMSQMVFNTLDGFCKHNLKEVADRAGIKDLDKTEQLSDWYYGDHRGGNLSLNQLIYSANDVLILWKIINHLEPLIQKENLNKPLKTEQAFTEVLVQIAVNGLWLDVTKAKEFKAIYEKEYDNYSQVVNDFFMGLGIGQNITDTFLKELLNRKFDQPDQPIIFDIDSPVENTDKETLQEFYYIPAIRAYAERKTIKQSLDTIDRFIALAEEYSGYIHPNFKQHIITARTASREPNFQNVPSGVKVPHNLKHLPLLRECFKAPEGYKFIICDLASAHARIAVQESMDPVFIDFFNSGKDIHLYTASLVSIALGKDLTFDQMTEIYHDKNHNRFGEVKKLRSMAKSVFYGSLNGQGARTLIATVLKDTGEEIELDQAQAIIKSFKEGYSGLSACFDRIVEEANKHDVKLPWVKNYSFAKVYNASGRYALYPKFKNDRSGATEAKPNNLYAFTWMATEAEIMKQSAILLHHLFKRHPEWDAKIVNLVHDELDIYAKVEHAETVAKHTIAVMDSCFSYWVKCIPPNDVENQNPAKAVCSAWSDK